MVPPGGGAGAHHGPIEPRAQVQERRGCAPGLRPSLQVDQLRRFPNDYRESGGPPISERQTGRADDCFTSRRSPAVGAGMATEDMEATEGQVGLAGAQITTELLGLWMKRDMKPMNWCAAALVIFLPYGVAAEQWRSRATRCLEAPVDRYRHINTEPFCRLMGLRLLDVLRIAALPVPDG